MANTQPRKKRVRPARKIVRRANMGRAWVIAPVVVAAIIFAAGIWFLATRS